MICLNSACQATIPDDSKFCDQCGKAVVAGSSHHAAAAKPEASSEPKADAATAFAGRPRQAMDSQHLKLSLSNGVVVELQSGDILGNAEGPLAQAWKDASLVSGRHGRVESFDGSWTYTDLFSANGSSLNGHFVRPGIPVAVQTGDKLVLGNRSFLVL